MSIGRSGEAFNAGWMHPDEASATGDGQIGGMIAPYQDV
jgi:hypothetical protein